MSVEYDNSSVIGEEYRMAPEGIITDDNIDQLTEMATEAIPPQPEPEPQEIPTNKMEAPIKEKVNRKKQRSQKQKETFEKARQKRLENIAKKKAEREAREKQVEADMDKVKETPMTTNPELPSMEEQVKQLEEIQNEVIKQEPILKKPPAKQKKEKKQKKVVYVEESSSEESSSEEEIVYVKRKPRKPRRKVVYQDDFGEEAEFIQPPRGPYPRRNKPISFSDVFKYA